MFIVPLPDRAPEEAEPTPETGLPTMLRVPVELFTAPNELADAPPVGFPVMLSVPVLVFVAPWRLPVVADASGLPTNVAELPEVPEYVTHVVDPAIALLPDPVNVNVTPFASVKPPPATAVVPAVVLTVFAVRSESTVTVCPFAYTSSPTAGSVPPFQVPVADQFPVATAHRSAGPLL
jgi:hypothetical protein